jgi:hypothetical protein
MTKEQILDVCSKYDQMLAREGFLVTQEHFEYGSLNHCRYMLNKIPTHLKENKIEKSNRWLGFVQGILWANGYCDIKLMKEHNRDIIDETLTNGKSFMMYGD